MILSKECHERGCAAYDDRVDEGVVIKGDEMKAFPNMTGEKGMDLRDYFAAKAMPLAMQWLKHNYDREIGNTWMWNEEDYEDDPKEIAELAYKMADAMIKARERS